MEIGGFSSSLKNEAFFGVASLSLSGAEPCCLLLFAPPFSPFLVSWDSNLICGVSVVFRILHEAAVGLLCCTKATDVLVLFRFLELQLDMWHAFITT